jgi:hypothetical protein
VRYAFVAQHCVQRACNVSQSAHPTQQLLCLAEESVEQTAREDARRTDLIRKAWESGRVYGYRKLPDDLLDQGKTVAPIASPVSRSWPGSRRRSATSAGPDPMAASHLSWSTTP